MSKRRWQTIGFPLVIAVLASAIYLNALDNDFTFDDFHKIIENPVVTSPDWKNPATFFIPTPPRIHHPDRSIPQFVLALEYAMWGDHPLGYHLVNVILHTCVALLLFAVSLELFPGRRRLCFLAAALFACHPIHTDVVASVIGMGELLSSLCFLLALWIYVKSTASESAGWSWAYWSTMPILLIGAFSKETAAWTLPFVAGAVDVFRFVVPRKMSPAEYLRLIGRRLVKFYLPWLAVLVGVALFSLSVTSSPEVTANFMLFMPLGERVLTAMGIFMRYVVLLVWPLRLSCDYSYSQLSFQSPPVQFLWIAGGVVTVVAGLVLACWSLRKTGRYFLALFIFAVNYGIISNMLVVINVSMAERLIYAASMGFCLAVGLVLESALTRCDASGVWRGKRAVVWMLIVFILIAYSIRTWTRNRDWKDNFSLFSAAYRVCPMSCRVNYNLGLEYAQRNRLEQAVFHYEKAVEAIPWQGLYHLNLGEAYVRKGDVDKAVGEFEKVVRLVPDQAGGFINLGAALQEKGAHPKAFTCLTIARELGPDDWRAYFNMGNLCMAQGYVDRAVDEYRQTVKLNPAHWNAWNRLGAVYLRTGRHQEALAAFGEALALFPEYKEAHNNMGLACARLGLKKRAEQAFRRALAIDPNFGLARSNLERLMR